MLTNKLTGAGAADKTYIEDVFSTYLYTGKAETQVINNGIDLAGKGGMVWCKARSQDARNNVLIDTNRGIYYPLFSNLTDASNFNNDYLTSVSSTGFSLRNDGYNNQLNQTYASWTFRKAPKFFDVVTWTGNSVSNRAISHSLGQTPGMIIVKKISESSDWVVWHRSFAGPTYSMYLNTTAGVSNADLFGTSSPTSASFYVQAFSPMNETGQTYVAYLFAHDTTTDGLIQCGSFTSGVSGNVSVNLGWEPQYLLFKRTDSSGQWYVMDTMRGYNMTQGYTLYPNLTNAESATGWSGYANPTATGFEFVNSAFIPGQTYIYMAIRRGPMRTPTDGTKVFSPVAYTGDGIYPRTIGSLNVTDLAVNMIRSAPGGITLWIDRLRGGERWLYSNSTSDESGLTGWKLEQTGQIINSVRNTSPETYIDWLFRRAPGFFDVVCYTGTGANLTVNHNLGVAPELLIVKKRSSTGNWSTWNKDIGNNYLLLNTTNAASATGNTARTITSSTFEVYGNFGDEGQNGATYVAYLFASCPGVSKVGSYTGNGSSQTINCGFTNGARFVLIKKTDGSGGNWWVFDTARGITTGNDPWLLLNSTSAEGTSDDIIDPNSTGFTLDGGSSLNESGGSYIYLAIA